MPILKVKNKKGELAETKLVGVHLPRLVSDYLTLYSLAFGITKTIIVRNEVQHWKESQMETEQELGKMIGKKARVEQKKWDSKILFKKQLKSDLESKGISAENIQTILITLE